MPTRVLGTPRWIVLTGALLPIAACVIAAARYGYHAAAGVETRAHAESTYVAKVNYERARIIDSLSREARDVRIDNALATLVRACRQQGACKP